MVAGDGFILYRRYPIDLNHRSRGYEPRGISCLPHPANKLGGEFNFKKIVKRQLTPYFHTDSEYLNIAQEACHFKIRNESLIIYKSFRLIFWRTEAIKH